ncbi:MAG: hydroxyacid dehydrogenase [Acidisphaera sp.]|nr:hydroxyacid dehydrogenase [Acidisphaera sp.]
MSASNRKKLLLPGTMGRAGWDVVRARADIEAVSYAVDMPTPEFRAILADADGIALSVTPFREAEIAAAPRLAVVARIGVGYDAVEVPALTQRRIPLMVAGLANAVSVAEHAVFLMMALAKRGARLHELVQQGKWPERFANLPVDLFERTVLIVGFGRIGTRTAARCRAMEMRVLIYDPYVPAAAIRAAGCEPAADLDAAVAEADFITIHCPKNPETTGMFDAARLARMKPTAFLVNTARGGIIDETALHGALTSGRLAGAGLDVFEQEPTPVDNPLLHLPNVITAPHVAGVTRESLERMAVATARNLLSVLDGTPIRENVINKEVLS